MIESIGKVFYHFDNKGILILSVFAALYLFRLYYRLFFTGSFMFVKKTNTVENSSEKLSVLIFGRNQGEDLGKNLPTLLELNNKSLEVVAVDDFSADNSYTILGLLHEKYKNLKISTLNQETRNSLKIAANIAIKAASNNWVLVASPSFCNSSNEWLNFRIKSLATENEVVVAYSSFEVKRGLLNTLFRADNFWQFLTSAGYAKNGLAFVYSEENVAFKKQNYFNVGGYRKLINEPYANLELVINRFISRKNSQFIFHPQAITKSDVGVTRKMLFDQWKKQIRIEKNLGLIKQFFIRFEEFTQIIYLPALVLITLVYKDLWPVLAFLFLIQLILFLLIIKTAQKRLNEPKIFISSLVYGFVVPLFKVLYRWHFKIRSRKQKWKRI